MVDQGAQDPVIAFIVRKFITFMMALRKGGSGKPRSASTWPYFWPRSGSMS